MNKSSQYTMANFLDQLAVLVDASITIDLSDQQQLTLSLDWEKASLNILSSSQRGRDALVTRIRRLLFLADQPEATTGADT